MKAGSGECRWGGSGVLVESVLVAWRYDVTREAGERGRMHLGRGEVFEWIMQRTCRG